MYAYQIENCKPVLISAKTLTSAKRIASKHQPLCCTVSVLRNGEIVAVKKADRLNANLTGVWESV